MICYLLDSPRVCGFSHRYEGRRVAPTSGLPNRARLCGCRSSRWSSFGFSERSTRTTHLRYELEDRTEHEPRENTAGLVSEEAATGKAADLYRDEPRGADRTGVVQAGVVRSGPRRSFLAFTTSRRRVRAGPVGAYAGRHRPKGRRNRCRRVASACLSRRRETSPYTG